MTSTKYRILTEDCNRWGVVGILDKHLEAYTIIPAYGWWKGEIERTLIIEVVLPDVAGGNTEKILKLAAEIKALNKQEAVMVEKLIVCVDMV